MGINYKDCIVPIKHKPPKQKKNKGLQSDTLCWYCDRAYGSCSWSQKINPSPVKGWNAIKGYISYKRTNGECDLEETYTVLECPEFEVEPLFENEFKKFSIQGCIDGIQIRNIHKNATIKNNRRKCNGKNSRVSKSKLQTILMGLHEKP